MEASERHLEMDGLMKGHYILTLFLVDVLSKIRSIPKAIKKYAKIKGYKESGYLVVRSIKDGIVLLVLMLGNCPPKKAKKYLHIALERGERLFHHPNHVSSSQSQDKRNRKQEGAIVAGDYIVSFAGTTGPLDEAIAIELSVLCRWNSTDKAQEIADISRNHLYDYLK